MTALRRILGTLALVTLFVLPAGATVIKSLTLADMTKEADTIVQATVERQTVTWDDRRKLIHTFTEVEVVESLKGGVKAGQKVIIRQIGGDLGDEALLVSGNALLEPGGEVVLFLDRDERMPLHYVVGMAQGKYEVDRSTPTPRVGRNLHGLTFLQDPKADPKLPRIAGDQPRPAPSIALDDFKAEIRALVAAH